MDLEVKLLVERAENELLAARTLKMISENAALKNSIELRPESTFYSAVISHAYYTIFYCAKAYLLSKKIPLPEQGQHQAVYFGFKKLVREGQITEDLLKLYDEVKVKAETLLEIFETEEENRTKFTYKTSAQANKEPAESSIKNSQLFFSYIRDLIGIK